MPADSTADDLTALREALLSNDLEPPDSALMRAAERLADRRGRLRWLAVPLMLLGAIPGMVGLMRRGRTFLANDIRTVQLYSELSGKDLDVSQADVHRIRMQLGLIKEALPQPEGLAASSPSRASRAQLEAAVDALMQYFLRGRQTDDPLLAETQAAYAAYDQLLQQCLESAAEGRTRRRRLPEEQRWAEASDRYIEAWWRWFEQNKL
jgi:hypothetical protein